MLKADVTSEHTCLFLSFRLQVSLLPRIHAFLSARNMLLWQDILPADVLSNQIGRCAACSTSDCCAPAKVSSERSLDRTALATGQVPPFIFHLSSYEFGATFMYPMLSITVPQNGGRQPHLAEIERPRTYKEGTCSENHVRSCEKYMADMTIVPTSAQQPYIQGARN